MADPTSTPVEPAAVAAPSPAPSPTPTVVSTPAPTATPEPTATPAAAPTPEPQSWYQDDWRERLANGDQKKLRVLNRYKDPNAWSEAGFNLRFARESGEFLTKLPDEPSTEEVTTYRKENGIPADPNGYWGSMKFDNGLVIGDEDKPMVNEFMQMAHAEHWTPKQVKTAVAAHYKFQEQAQIAMAERDEQDRQTAEDTLRTNMSPADYRANKASLERFVGRFPEKLQPLILNARLGNNQALFNNLDFVNWAAQLEREMNPAHTVVGASGNAMAAIEDELKQIADFRTKDRAAYFADEKMQARERELLSAQERQRARAA